MVVGMVTGGVIEAINVRKQTLVLNDSGIDNAATPVPFFRYLKKHSITLLL